jgi:hypothetical protein
MSKEVIWQLMIGLAGIVYIVVALSQNVESPVLALIVVLVAGYEVIESYHGRNKS